MRLILAFILSSMLSCLGAASGGAFVAPDKLFNVVTIPSGAGAITNIVWRNNTAYILDQGTNYTEVNRAGADSYATTCHIQMTNLTNVTLRGLNWGSVVFSTNVGNFFRVKDCENLTFEDFAVVGTRHIVTNGNLFACFNLEGTNSLTFRRMRLKNQVDHGITQLSTGGNPSRDSRITVDNCLFENIGFTNSFPSSTIGDGAAVQIPGPHTKIINTRFVECALGIEFEGPATNRIHDILIQGNSFIDGAKDAIVNFDTYLMDQFEDVTIANNYFKYDQTKALLNRMGGVFIKQIRTGKIIGNTFVTNYNAITFQGISPNTGGVANQDFMDGWIIENNTFSTIYNFGIQVDSANSQICDGFIIRGNYFTNVALDGFVASGNLRRSLITGNTFSTCAQLGIGEAVVRLVASVGAAHSNTISGNTFLQVATAMPCVSIGAGNNYNIVEDNKFWHIPGGPWSDAGTGTRFVNNWVGSNMVATVPYTNTFQTTFGGGTPGGTNIIWNVAALPVQVMVLTNTGLLIITNNAPQNLGTSSRIVLVNNQTTNVGVFASVAGVRLFGVDSALLSSATAAAHNSLTNGRSMTLDCTYVGTNLAVTVNHQR